MGYFTKLIDQIWNKPSIDSAGHGRYTIPQILSLFVLLAVITVVFYTGEYVLNLIKGFLVDG